MNKTHRQGTKYHIGASRRNVHIKAEIYFSVVQRKALTPNNFADLDTLERTLLAFGRRYEQIAQPFEWKFTRKDLQKVLDRLDQRTPELQLAA